MADTEDVRMMLESSLADTINMLGLEKSGHHLPDKFIKMLLGLSLVQGGREQITYEILHKGWSILWCLFLDESRRAPKRYREEDMAET